MLWLIALMLLCLAGLNAPLAACALSMAALSGGSTLRPEFAWLATPWLLGLALGLLALQLLADLYFVPITVKDRIYLHPYRTEYAYVHARAQSLFRPLTGAVLIAALPLGVAEGIMAVVGFTATSGIYWLSAWIREYVAVTRGAMILLTLEALKNALLIVLAVLTFWLPPLALLLLLLALLPTLAWNLRLQREHGLYQHLGGTRAGEDT